MRSIYRAGVVSANVGFASATLRLSADSWDLCIPSGELLQTLQVLFVLRTPRCCLVAAQFVEADHQKRFAKPS